MGREASGEVRQGGTAEAAKPDTAAAHRTAGHTGVPEHIHEEGLGVRAVDAAWAEHGKPEKFKYDGKAKVGGAHEKEFWIDENGDKWLFKPVGKASDDFIAHGEEAAYKMGG